MCVCVGGVLPSQLGCMEHVTHTGHVVESVLEGSAGFVTCTWRLCLPEPDMPCYCIMWHCHMLPEQFWKPKVILSHTRTV